MDSTILQVQTLDGCVRAQDRRHCLQKKEMSSTKWKCPSWNNIHPLKFKEVRQGQCLSVSVNVRRSKPPAVNSSQMGSQASAPSLPQWLPARLMSTTVSFDFKAVAKAWPWNAFRVQCWIILMQGILQKLEFKNTDLKVFGIRWSRQTSFWRCSPAEQNGYDPHTKRAKMCSNIICHVYTRPLFLRRAQKASPEPTRRKSIRWALMPSRPMEQNLRFRCVRVRFVFSISARS